MKISDEIRKWCDDAYSGRKIRTTKDLRALADLIDREMVELPKDVDGEPIHVGDTVYVDDGLINLVTEIDIMQDGCKAIECWDGSKHVACHPADLTHERPDSFERIADELDDLSESGEMAGETSADMRELADRIRRLVKKEGKL